MYVDDVRIPGTLRDKALRSPHHHAGITRLDTKKAEALPGVFAIVTSADVPKNVYGHLEALGIPADEPLLAADDIRYKGQPIAAVAAVDDDTARAAIDAIEIEFEERPAFFDIRKAVDGRLPALPQWGPRLPPLRPYQPPRVREGDVDRAFE